MTVNTDSYELDQFDLIYNRPDLVLGQLKARDKTIMAFYENAYKNRIQGFGDFIGNTGKMSKVPGISFNDQITANDTTFTPTFSLPIAIRSNGVSIRSLHIRVNGVPLYKPEGLLFPESTNDTTLTVQLSLLAGKSNIIVYADNKNKLKSLVLSKLIYYKVDKPVKPNLYVLAVAVGKGQEKALPILDYAVKDGTDIVDLFHQKLIKESFNQVFEKTLFDSAATKQNILDSKKFFDHAQPEDIVVVYLSGHGTVNASNNFLYCSYDFNLNNNERSGVSLSNLSDLLDGLRAQKRLLLIDACNSGTSDFDRKMTENANKLIPGNLSRIKEMMTLLNLSFGEINRESGTALIAASASSATQISRYHNGIFTHCIKEGLINQLADTNRDGFITVGELKDYLFFRIYEDSLGDQRPISKLVNYGEDWAIISKTK